MNITAAAMLLLRTLVTLKSKVPGQKAWPQSKTIVNNTLGIIAWLLNYKFGIDLGPTDMAQLAEIGVTLIGVGTNLRSIYGRLKATIPISS